MRLLALIVKEFRQVRRDSSSILLAFVLPILMLMLFGYCVNLDSSVTELALVTDDESPEAHSLLDRLQGTPHFHVERAADEREAMERLRRGTAHGALIIPSDFSRDCASGETPRLLLATDGSVPNTAQFTQLYLQSVCSSWLAERAAAAEGAAGVAASGDSSSSSTAASATLSGGSTTGSAGTCSAGASSAGARSASSSGSGASSTSTASADLSSGTAATVEVVSLYRFNSAALSRRYILPGSIAVVISFVGTFLTAMVVAREWERGTMELLLASPMTRAEFILSKLIPYFLLGVGAMAVCTLAATLIFDVPLRAPLWLLFGITSIFLLSVLAIGLLISTLLRSQYTASLVSLNVSVLPTIMLSGFIFEISSMPGWVQAVSYLIPARYFAPSLSTLFLAGAEWAALLLNLLLLVLSALFWLGLVFLSTPKRLDS